MATPTQHRRKQNALIRNNPWLVEMLGDNKARVPSASGDRTYLVDLAANYCNCEAHGSCWHLDTAELRARLDVTVANCLNRYSKMRLAELRAEDKRLRAVLAEHDSISVRTQYGVCGDMIALCFCDSQVAA